MVSLKKSKYPLKKKKGGSIMESDSRTSQSSLLPAAPPCGVYGSRVHSGAGAGVRADQVSEGHPGCISWYFSPAEELGWSWRLRNDELPQSFHY